MDKVKCVECGCWWGVDTGCMWHGKIEVGENIDPNWEKGNDPGLQGLYREKLLEPGWGGELTIAEAEYIADHLAQDAKLRRQWGFKKRKTYPLVLIARKAMPENPARGYQLMANKLASLASRKRSESSQRGRSGQNVGSRKANPDSQQVELMLGEGAAAKFKEIIA